MDIKQEVEDVEDIKEVEDVFIDCNLIKEEYDLQETTSSDIEKTSTLFKWVKNEMEKGGKTSKRTTDEDRISWSPEMVADLIEAVHKEPVIWDYKSRQYKDRHSRYDGFQSVYDKISHHSPELSPDICRVKWNNVKSYYQIILNNEKKTQSGGPYKKPPTWIHYTAMHFLKPLLSATKTDDNFKLENNSTHMKTRSHSDTQEEEVSSHASMVLQEAENQEQSEETSDESDSKMDITLQSPRQQTNYHSHYPIPRIDHCLKKKRKKQDNAEDSNYVENPIVKCLEENRSRYESYHQQSTNEQRGLIWGQELDQIQDVQLRGECIIKITTILQEALMKDEEKRRDHSV